MRLSHPNPGLQTRNIHFSRLGNSRLGLNMSLLSNNHKVLEADYSHARLSEEVPTMQEVRMARLPSSPIPSRR